MVICITKPPSLACPSPFFTCSCGTVAGIVVGVVVVLLLLMLITAGVIIGVVLGRRRLRERKGKPSERNGESQEMKRLSVVGGTTGEGTEDHLYDDVVLKSSTDGQVALYQGLDVGTQDYVSMYTQLRWGTYQELDLRGREEEHHYQRVERERREPGSDCVLLVQ